MARPVREYRVEEYEKRFRILVKCDVACGFLWLFTREEWLPASKTGLRIQPLGDLEYTKKDKHLPCSTYSTLERALEQVYDFTPKMHTVDGIVDADDKPVGIFANYEIDVINELVSIDLKNNKYDTTNSVIRTDIINKLQQMRIKNG